MAARARTRRLFGVCDDCKVKLLPGDSTWRRAPTSWRVQGHGYVIALGKRDLVVTRWTSAMTVYGA